MASITFFTALSCILIHEMDAIQQKEWRIFPGLHLLNDRWGFGLFTALHLPLFVWLLASLFGPNGIDTGFREGFDIFCLVHLGLHLLFLLHPKNNFKTLFSWLWIVGAAICGALDLYGIL